MKRKAINEPSSAKYKCFKKEIISLQNLCTNIVLKNMQNETGILKFPISYENYSNEFLLKLLTSLFDRIRKTKSDVIMCFTINFYDWLSKISNSHLSEELFKDYLTFIDAISPFPLLNLRRSCISHYLVGYLVNLFNNSNKDRSKTLLVLILKHIKLHHVEDLYMNFIVDISKNIISSQDIEMQIFGLNYFNLINNSVSLNKLSVDQIIVKISNFLHNDVLKNDEISLLKAFILFLSNLSRNQSLDGAYLKDQFHIIVYIYTKLYPYLDVVDLNLLGLIIRNLMKKMNYKDVVNIYQEQFTELFLHDINLHCCYSLTTLELETTTKHVEELQMDLLGNHSQLFVDSMNYIHKSQVVSQQFSILLYLYSSSKSNLPKLNTPITMLVDFCHHILQEPDFVDSVYVLKVVYKLIQHIKLEYISSEYYKLSHAYSFNLSQCHDEDLNQFRTKNYFLKNKSNCYDHSKIITSEDTLKIENVYKFVNKRILETFDKFESVQVIVSLNILDSVLSTGIGSDIFDSGNFQLMFDHFLSYYKETKMTETMDKKNRKILKLQLILINKVLQKDNIFMDTTQNERYLDDILSITLDILFKNVCNLREFILKQSGITSYIIKTCCHHICSAKSGIHNDEHYVKIIHQFITNSVTFVNKLCVRNPDNTSSTMVSVTKAFCLQILQQLLANPIMHLVIFKHKLIGLFQLKYWLPYLKINSISILIQSTFNSLSESQELVDMFGYYRGLLIKTWKYSIEYSNRHVMDKIFNEIITSISQKYSADQVKLWLESIKEANCEERTLDLLVLAKLIRSEKFELLKNLYRDINEIIWKIEINNLTDIHVAIIAEILCCYTSQLNKYFKSSILNINLNINVNILQMVKFNYRSKYQGRPCCIDTTPYLLDTITVKLATRGYNYPVNLLTLSDNSFYFEALLRFHSSNTQPIFINLTDFSESGEEIDNKVLHHAFSLIIHVLHGSSLYNCSKIDKYHIHSRILLLGLRLADMLLMKSDCLVVYLDFIMSQMITGKVDLAESLIYLTHKAAPLAPTDLYGLLLRIVLNECKQYRLTMDNVTQFIKATIHTNQWNEWGTSTCVSLLQKIIDSAISS